MSTTIDRRAFLARGAATAAGLAIAGPLGAFRARTAMGAPKAGEGYGPLVDMGDLALPRGFDYRIISRQGDPMGTGGPTPGIFDGMAAYPGPRGTTVLIRNHENRERFGEIPVPVPPDRRYDPDPTLAGGCTKVVVRGSRVIGSFPVIGGTSTNCAGGETPWGSWITCEEVFKEGATGVRHGYAFEIDARTMGPVEPRPIMGAGRFVHEACAWLRGALYLTEDIRTDAALYRYVPERSPKAPGDLAASTGVLEALRLRDFPNGVNTNVKVGDPVFPGGWPVGQPFPVDWVRIDDPDPADNIGSAQGGNSTRAQAVAKGAARFDRQEGCWVSGSRLYFDCTDAGKAELGQIWEYDAARSTLTLIFETSGPEELKNPDNLVVTPTGDLLLCEDSDEPQFLRLLTVEGEISDFARTITNDSEFAGACFDPRGNVLYVNQQGSRERPDGAPVDQGVTYAITGPWRSLKGRS